MKRIILSLVLLFFAINSAALAAPAIAEFPLGMTKQEAVSKGLIMKDEQGGILVTTFGEKDWPTALTFENDKLVSLILKGSDEEFVAAANEGLLRLDWMVIHSATENNQVFDAFKLIFEGKSFDDVVLEYENFYNVNITQSQNLTKYTSTYISERTLVAFLKLRDQKPVEAYPDSTLCRVSAAGNDITLMFTTFAYMGKMN